MAKKKTLRLNREPGKGTKEWIDKANQGGNGDRIGHSEIWHWGCGPAGIADSWAAPQWPFVLAASECHASTNHNQHRGLYTLFASFGKLEHQ
jgi:hypothetical protein